MKSHEILLQKFKSWGAKAPALHVVLGSGLSSAFDDVGQRQGWTEIGKIPFTELPDISAATAPGHAGVFRYYRHEASGKSLCFQVGRLHGYEGLDPRQTVAPVLIAALAGSRRFVLTNAAGSLRKNFPTGSVMIIRDHVNMTGKNPLLGPNPKGPDGKPLGPRFPDMTNVYNKTMRERLKSACLKHELPVNEGVYLGLLGPTYETPAEVQLFARWGMDAVGMSTVWEAIALNHIPETEICGLSFMSNLAAGLSGETLNHEEVEREGRRIAGRLVAALFDFAGGELSKS